MEEFKLTAREVLGTYLDATMGMGELARGYMRFDVDRLDELQRSGVSITPEAFNPLTVYVAGPPGTESREVHQTTLHDLIHRNAPGGRNWFFLGGMCAVAIWEDHYRARLAASLRCEPSELVHDAFGELRHLRRSIIHGRGIALPEVGYAKILQRFKPGEPVLLEYEDVRTLVEAVCRAADDLLAKHAVTNG